MVDKGENSIWLDLWRSIFIIVLDMQKNEFMQLDTEIFELLKYATRFKYLIVFYTETINLRLGDANKLSLGCGRSLKRW